MFFHWSRSDSMSPPVSRILFWILADLINAVVWMVSILLPIYKRSSPLFHPLRTVLLALTTRGITISLMFHSFLSSQVFFYVFLFIFSQWSVGKFSFLWSIITRSNFLAGVMWSVCISKYPKILCLNHPLHGLCIYHLVVWSNYYYYVLL